MENDYNKFKIMFKKKPLNTQGQVAGSKIGDVYKIVGYTMIITH